eukprot:CAMPEP_0171247670 /NCGR_PEP_ID=MMETSP0790-20130122/48615_1 /TAXON_ID=2925 /ORGANISM="Alexandrium catenella, Strain OF101" /LENGTH=81 /DNA_ID=CAMNT_0011715087 /DNA_START=24 /DNA_END=265 /DNA_ORIENTATION=+
MPSDGLRTTSMQPGALQRARRGDAHLPRAPQRGGLQLLALSLLTQAQALRDRELHLLKVPPDERAPPGQQLPRLPHLLERL